MKRREAREIAFKLTYEMVMTGGYNTETADELIGNADKESRGYILSVIDGIAAHRDGLKAVIARFARGYEVERIYRTDLATLYLACYEIIFTDTPKAVAVNEAVEITKAYSDSLSYSFVNGILASVIKAMESGEISAEKIDSDAACAAADPDNDGDRGSAEDHGATTETATEEPAVAATCDGE